MERLDLLPLGGKVHERSHTPPIKVVVLTKGAASAVTRPRIAYLAPYSPDPKVFGGALRIDAMWRSLQATGEVRLFIVGDKPPLDARLRLRAHGAHVLPSRRESRVQWAVRCASAALRGESIPAARYLSPRRVARLLEMLRRLGPDVVVLGDEYLVVLAGPLRALGARLVVDAHNVGSRAALTIARASHRAFDKLAYAILASNTAAAERRHFPIPDEVWAVSEEDAGFYASLAGVRNVAVIPNVVDIPERPPGRGEPGAVVFVGSYRYWPNEDAALRLIRMLSDRSVPSLRRLYLVGTDPTRRILDAARGKGEVVVTGRVPDVAPWIARAAVVAVPLTAGSGSRLKILEAMAHGRPVLTTTAGAEGIALGPGTDADVVPITSFAEALDRLLRDEERRRRLAEAGRALVAERYSVGAMERLVRSRVATLLAGRGRA